MKKFLLFIVFLSCISFSSNASLFPTKAGIINKEAKSISQNSMIQTMASTKVFVQSGTVFFDGGWISWMSFTDGSGTRTYFTVHYT